MKVKKKSSIKVFGKIVPIIFTEEMILVEGNVVYGHYNNKLGEEAITIYCGSETTPEMVVTTYLHELFHCMFYRLGFENTIISHDVHELLADNYGKLLAENFDFEL